MTVLYRICKLAQHIPKALQVQKIKPCFVKPEFDETCASTNFTVASGKPFFFKVLGSERTQIGLFSCYPSTRGFYRFSSLTFVRRHVNVSNGRPSPTAPLGSFAGLLRATTSSNPQPLVAPQKQSKTKYISQQTLASPLHVLHSKKQNKQILENRDSSANIPEIKLFVNLLMKDGKKTKALYILEMAALLFIKSISKTDLYTKPNINPQIQKEKPVSNFVPFVLQGGKQDKKAKEGKFKLAPAISKSVPSMHTKQKAHTTQFFIHKNMNFVPVENLNFFLPSSQSPTAPLGSFAELLRATTGSNPQPLVAPQSKSKASPPLDPVLQDFYIKREVFANSNLTSKKYRGFAIFANACFDLRKQQPEQHEGCNSKKPFLSSARPSVKDVRSIATENKERLWYATPQVERWHKCSDIQKNTLLFALYTAISNVKPPLEVRSKRVGGSNRQIPAAVSESRQRGYAIRWIIESAKMEKAAAIQRKKRVNATQMRSSGTLQSRYGTCQFDRTGEKSKNMNFVPLFSISLAESLKNAFYKKGLAFQRRNLWIETAAANRAFLRYRWW